MRFHIHRKVAAASAGVALLAIASSSRAQLQLDTNPPAPNVLILLDNSGSMERMIDGNTPETDGNACNYDMTGKAIPTVVPPQPNRWGSVLQALTGTFENNVYNCIDMSRATGGAFAKEYQINGIKPYDADYYLDYHRPVFLDTSTPTPTACVIAPGALPGAPPGAGVGQNGASAGGAATDFPTNGIVMRPFNQPTVAVNAASGPCSQYPNNEYSAYQYQDGAIPSSTALMRFGLMTFDQDPSPGIGVTIGSNPTVLGNGVVDMLSPSYGAFAGMWSYFPGWNTGAACTSTGMPVGCTMPQMLAVGARNPAAPPWEGRMMPFPATDDLAAQETNNANIASVILAARPYGATPLAGMLAGAEYYFWNDPIGPQKQDPLVFCGDRPQYIIILTDGAPNLDMRLPTNATTGGCTDPNCPFKTPDAIVSEMNSPSGGNSPITTYVIGFAVSSATIDSTLYQCSTLAANGGLSGLCNPSATDPPLNAAASACCELQKIALAGSQNIVSNNLVVPNPTPTPAFFADSPGALQKALSDILANLAKDATTRTVPAYAASSQSVYADPNSPTTVGSQYLASFNPSPGKPLTGDIVRTRDVCQQSGGSFGVTPTPPDPTAGDDFGANLNSNAGNARTFIAFQPDPIPVGPKPIDATATIRPYYVAKSVNDGFGNYSATTYAGPATSVIPNITPAALGIVQPCPYSSSSTNVPISPGLTTTQCATMTLDYLFGQQSFTGNPGNFPFVSRYGQALGGIYHASPAIVGPPSTLLQDPGYSGFQGTWQTRDGIAYVATTDGLLHAFWTDETKLENNERWAMLLPAVMTNVYPAYPSSPNLLLDGSPIVKDVAWDRTIASSIDPTVWHTMLVAGFGSNNRGYYAVDVTNPDASKLSSGAVPPDSPLDSGPHLRWQLTTAPATNYTIFAAHSATPAITTLFLDPGDGGGQREIAVAILPGGSDGSPTTSATSGSSCTRAGPTIPDSEPLNIFQARKAVRCWGASKKATDPVNGRSVAVVRVDTGEILRVFARQADAKAATADTLLAANLITDTPLDSPMTGTPLVFPSDVATDATKAFVSDADGTIWRFDLSNPDPTKWTGTLFLDLYNQTVDNNPTAWADGQPLSVTPTLSTDTTGEIVLNAATGVTDTFDSNGIEFVYSITEKVQGDTTNPQALRAFVNWYMATPLTPASNTAFVPPPTPQDTAASPAFLPGERVSGPMVVFDGKLYFATYIVPPPSTVTCVSNVARVWGVDFVKPADTSCNDPTTAASCNRAAGGVPSFLSGTKMETDISPLTTASAPIRTAVIPGLTINATPACAGAGTPTTDQYVGGGAQHSSPQGMSAGKFQLSAQVGAPGANGLGASSINLDVPTPLSPTVIDSWAAVLE
jgi:type IV pilus assembly protein PilY1